MRDPVPNGVQTLYSIEGGVWTPIASKTNSWAATWGYIAAMAMLLRDTRYAVNAMYIEYENVASPSDPVAIPSYQPQDGRSYYEGLASSQNRDYLRVPLVPPASVEVAPGYEAFFPQGQGNQATIVAWSSGSSGMTGKPFSDSAHSKVCGVALVAAPSWADRTKDVIFSRSYYDISDQALKTASNQFGVSYTVAFKLPGD